MVECGGERLRHRPVECLGRRRTDPIPESPRVQGARRINFLESHGEHRWRFLRGACHRSTRTRLPSRPRSTYHKSSIQHGLPTCIPTRSRPYRVIPIQTECHRCEMPLQLWDRKVLQRTRQYRAASPGQPPRRQDQEDLRRSNPNRPADQPVGRFRDTIPSNRLRSFESAALKTAIYRPKIIP